jgi:hypothetical protein
MYHSAVQGGLDFYETTTDVQRAVVRGSLVEITGNSNYIVSRVKTPYVRPETKKFVTEFAAEYHDACGEQMVVTSAVRPMSRKLRNGSSLTVHPTGMAVDLRKPKGACLKWLRRTLLSSERQGVVEATEERHPAHFHVAVLPTDIEKVSASNTRKPATRRSRR